MLYPPMSKGIEKIPALLGKVITWVIIFFLACDFSLLTAAAMLRYTDRQNNPEPKNVAEAFLDDTYDDDWMEHHWPNMVVTKDVESLRNYFPENGSRRFPGACRFNPAFSSDRP